MNSINFQRLDRILCIGAHADDIEIGCGGSILRLINLNPNLEVMWVVATCNAERAEEARDSARQFLGGAKSSQVRLWDFRDGFLPYQAQDVKEAFFALEQEFKPDLVFTHRLEDRHQDHRFLAELTWNTYRHHPILEYEIPKYEGDLGQPNLFVTLSQDEANRKMDLLLACFKSQLNKPWFQRQTFESLMRLRGLESKSPSKLAEGFTARKLVY